MGMAPSEQGTVQVGGQGKGCQQQAGGHGLGREWVSRQDQSSGASPRESAERRPTAQETKWDWYPWGDYIRPMTWPSGSAKSATMVSGATSVGGMRTRPPAASTRSSVACASSDVT